MKTLKGKKVFSFDEIRQLEELIKLRVKSPADQQKGIRDKMRKIGFYGKDDWGIVDLQLADLKWLIKSGQIKIIDSRSIHVFEKSKENEIKIKERVINTIETTLQNSDIDLKEVLESLKGNCFDPMHDLDTKVNDEPGNYIICLKNNSTFPETTIKPILKIFNGLRVIYTGIAGTSLRKRDLRQHFRGNAGGSTLRKSIGVLFGYKLIARDKDKSNGKTKFSTTDENKLSEWMQQNLLMYFYSNNNHNNIEIELINHFNPPLNLKGNKNIVNSDFRNYLSSLRTHFSKLKRM